MVREFRREQWFVFIAKALFWAALIILPLYFLQPLLSQAPSASQFQDVLKAYQGQLPN